jgi:hypothetical protein
VPIVSMVCGALLFAISLWSFSVTEAKSFTIWIPAIFGAILALCGAIALKESLLKHAMHAAAAVGLIGGAIAGGRWLMKMSEGAELNTPPMIATGKMALVCIVFVALCVNSFIQARRRRQAA